MNLERVAAESFLAELVKIANDTADDGVKTAAMTLHGEMAVEQVEFLIKEAGLMSGLFLAGQGALKGGLNVARGAGRGAMGAAKGVGQGIVGKARSMGRSVAAAPGNLGQRLSNFGARLETAGAAKGTQLAQRGVAAGEQARNRISGQGGGALNDIANFQKANRPTPTAGGSALDRLSKAHGPEGARSSISPPAAVPGAVAPARVPQNSDAPSGQMDLSMLTPAMFGGGQARNRTRSRVQAAPTYGTGSLAA